MILSLRRMKCYSGDKFALHLRTYHYTYVARCYEILTREKCIYWLPQLNKNDAESTDNDDDDKDDEAEDDDDDYDEEEEVEGKKHE